ncbi:MAG: hypothetical protein AB7O43_06490 [Hyphomicrobiaceae bacterium]
MTAPARHSIATSSDFYSLDGDVDYATWELSPGERVGPPNRGSRGRAFLGRALLVLILLGSGWALVADEGFLAKRLLTEIQQVYASIQATPPRLAEAPIPEPVAPVPTADIRPISPMANATVVPAADAAASSDSTSASTPAEPLDGPPAPPDDPLRARAEAAGLHPGLSRVLLERLSPADYRNAEYAIRTALAKTPDDGKFVWPRQRKPELALFTVHFVAGAASKCRRYVVTVMKDRWLTTALPMEKCGIAFNLAKSK